MKIRTATVVAAVVVALSGCASLPQDNPLYRTYIVQKDTCKATKCTINVWVSGGKVYTDVDEVGIDAAYTDVRIEWQLLKWPWSDYEFRDDSIEFKAGSGYGDQFSDPVASDDRDQAVKKGGKKFRWTDRNTNNKPYGYTIKVYQENSVTPFLLDPTIKNQG